MNTHDDKRERRSDDKITPLATLLRAWAHNESGKGKHSIPTAPGCNQYLVDLLLDAADEIDAALAVSSTRHIELEKANVGLANEAVAMRLALSELVEAGDALAHRDDMPAAAEEAAQKRWDEAQEAARPFTEAALLAGSAPSAIGRSVNTAFVKDADLSAQKTVDTVARDAARYRFRHSNYVDKDGYEYGYCKVRWKNGAVESMLWADDAEIDAAIAASATSDGGTKT